MANAREVGIKFCNLLLSQRNNITKKLMLDRISDRLFNETNRASIVIQRAKERGVIEALDNAINEELGITGE